ncbi:MAG: BACON domain-containing protein, partial [Alistipes sp.]|nr:BACON domain-containing protein [Alistipes sp.]
MKKTIFGKLLFAAMALLAVTSFTACVDDNDDVGMPYLELDLEELPFTVDGGDATFTVTTNRPWTATLDEGSEWISMEPMSGDGTTEVEISIPASTYGRVGKVNFHLSNSYAVYLTRTIQVLQGEVQQEELIYSETVGTASVSSPYPLVADYTAWNTEGTGAANVAYTGKNASVRASGLANAGSGPNVIFFGAAPATFQVNNIALQPQQGTLALSFLGSFSYKPEGSSEYNNTFDLEQFSVEISGDGQKWSKVNMTKNDGDKEHPYWIEATSLFTLTEVPEQLSIRFTAGFASAFRLDDIKLVTANGLGQEINLSEGVEGGDTPTPDVPVTPTDALWHENFGDNGENKPLVKDYTNWEKGGTVGANVTYEAPSGNVSVRESGKLSAGYEGASGAAKLFFGTNDPVFVVGNIALTAEQTKLRLGFGGAYSKQSGGAYDNTFYKDKFHVYVSGDGQKWTELSYTTAQADEYWIYATADFT